jgi:hypothetical protein
MGANVAELDLQTLAALLEAQGRALGLELRALPPELCRWRPGENEWSANETLGHLIEAERRGFNGRIRRILAEDRPQLPGWNQVEVAAARRDVEQEPAALLAEFEALRADSLALVRGLSLAQLDRGGEHAQVGWVTVRDLLHEWQHHDRNHVKQVYSIVQSYVWPSMGNCRRFAEVD